MVPAERMVKVYAIFCTTVTLCMADKPPAAEDSYTIQCTSQELLLLSTTYIRV